MKGGYADKTYKTYDPNDEAKAEGGRLSPRQKECWALCQKYAQDMLDKKLPSKIGNRNMIANKGKDNAASYDAWGKKCDLEIGEHAFGYDPAHDPDATRRAPSVIADILTVVDYETPHETSNGERRWESLRRLYDRGVGAIKERPCDYAFTSPTQRLDETVRRLTASNSYASLDNGLDKRAFDNALMACVDPSSEVDADMRYDPFFWMIGQALAVQ